jgi:phospholipase/lecithinase/hemolysin
MKNTIIAAGFTLLSFTLPFGAAAATFSKLYVFGDSLSDTGNVFNATKFVNSFIDPTIPIDPPPAYFDGRYSNGPIWVDYVADALNLTVTPSTELAVPFPVTITPTGELGINFFFNGATTTQSVNFAFGGAKAGLDNIGDPRLPGVLREVQGFTDDLTLAQQSADPNALYIVWAAGSNDYNSGSVPSQVVSNISTAVTSLFNAGARNILVPNAPDLGKTARARTLSEQQAIALTNLSNTHNLLLEDTLSNLSQSLTDINLISLDVNSLFNDAIENPGKFGLTNVTQACLSISECVNADQNVQNQYLFWDGIHPTTSAHQQLAAFALETLDSKPVPEPTSSAALGVLGLTWLLWGKFKKSREESNSIKETAKVSR